MATAAAIYACGPLGYSLNPSNGYLIAVATQLPLIPAVAIQATLLDSSSRQREELSARNIGWFRVAHVVLLTALAASASGITASYLTVGPEAVAAADVGSFALVRNVLALTGCALVSGYLLGVNLGWICPLAWAVIPFVVTRPEADADGIITLLGQPDDEFLPALFAAGIWIIGVISTFTKRGGRKRAW